MLSWKSKASVDILLINMRYGKCMTTMRDLFKTKNAFDAVDGYQLLSNENRYDQKRQEFVNYGINMTFPNFDEPLQRQSYSAQPKV